MARSAAVGLYRLCPAWFKVDAEREVRHSLTDERHRGISGSMNATDVGPFIIVLMVGVLCGRLITRQLAWVVALVLPTAHFVLSVVTGRAGEDLVTYAIPINIGSGCLAAGGAILGRFWRRSVVRGNSTSCSPVSIVWNEPRTIARLAAPEVVPDPFPESGWCGRCH